jgi:branched-chain amino acid transport system ATP-binding protein
LSPESGNSIPRAGADAGLTLLDVRDLVVRRGGKTVAGPVSLNIAAGEIVFLIGANGAGKTSIVEAVVGLLPVKSGAVSFGGEEISGLRAEHIVRKGLALVPEGRQLFLDQTVEDNLILGCYKRARDKAYLKELLAETYERFPVLANKRRHSAATLSGGEQQMLALSRALMSRPQVLILDEPSTGLAPLIVREFMTNLDALRADGLATLLVEQLVETALNTADRGYVLSRGQIIAAGTSEELRRSDELIGAYLGGHSAPSSIDG